jgi:hypothetical protein
MSVSYPSLPLAHSRGTGQWNGSCSDGGQEMGELTLALPVPLWWWCGGVTGKYGSQKPASRFRMPGMRSRVARQPAVARGSEVNRYSMPEEGHPTYGKPCEVSSRSVVLREGGRLSAWIDTAAHLRSSSGLPPNNAHGLRARPASGHRTAATKGPVRRIPYIHYGTSVPTAYL